MATVFVALFLLGLITLLAFFMNLGEALLTRARLQTMAELGAMGGGRVVAEELAERAGRIFLVKFQRAPDKEEQKLLYQFLEVEDVRELQEDKKVVGEVHRRVKDYVAKNQPPGITLASATTTYPLVFNLCDGNKSSGFGNADTVEVLVELAAPHQLLFPTLLKSLAIQPEITLSATGIYSVRVCP